MQASNCDNVEEAYRNSFKLLDRKYGNQFAVANHYLSKLEHWPIIKNDDPNALRDLSNFLQQCNSIMNGMSAMNQLNGPKEIKDIVKKLPLPMQRSFRELATTKMEKEEPVLFEDLVKFVSHQSRILDTPIFGELGKKPEKQTKKSFFAKSNHPCFCCKKTNHELNNCNFFNQKSMEEKRKFIKEKGICFGCMKNTEHESKDCKNRLTCTKCNGKHPSSLHLNSKKPEVKSTTDSKDTKEQKPEVPVDSGSTPSSQQKQPSGSSLHVKTQSSISVKKPAVLVDVRFYGSNKIIRTYMGIDTYCDSVYVDSDLIKEAAIQPEDISFSLTILFNLFNKQISSVEFVDSRYYL